MPTQPTVSSAWQYWLLCRHIIAQSTEQLSLFENLRKGYEADVAKMHFENGTLRRDLEGIQEDSVRLMGAATRERDRIEVLEGVKPDMQIVASGAAFLNNGDLVKVVK